MNKFASYNPANGSLVWEGASSNPDEIALKIASGQKAFPLWARAPLQERIALLEGYGKNLSLRENELVKAISLETGKTLRESKGEVAAMIGKIPLSIQAYQERCKTVKQAQGDYELTTTFRPHGLVSVFGPFNFPGHLPNGHIVPALLAGNTVIFKPSEMTPYVGELMGECFIDFPKGVFQIVQGGPDVGKELAASRNIQGIFFTGSAATGQILKEQNLKMPGRILALELGGNNPLVVSAISDIKAAASITIQSAFLTTGQRCSSARRLILTDKCPKTSFLNELSNQIKHLDIGAFDSLPEPFMGPLINLKAADALIEAQSKLIEKGAKPICLMKKLYPHLPFVTPALLDVTAVRDRPDVEYFGPFLQVIVVDSFEEAIQEANTTEYGLTAGILSDSQEEWDHFYHEIKAGIINRNAPLTGASSKAPFGGTGKSGNYRPSAFLAADYCSYPVASMQSTKGPRT